MDGREGLGLDEVDEMDEMDIWSGKMGGRESVRDAPGLNCQGSSRLHRGPWLMTLGISAEGSGSAVASLMPSKRLNLSNGIVRWN